jgi:hypothetical protein
VAGKFMTVSSWLEIYESQQLAGNLMVAATRKIMTVSSWLENL